MTVLVEHDNGFRASMVSAKTTLVLWMSCLLSSKAIYKLEAAFIS